MGRDAFSNCGKLEWARIESTIVPDTETGSHYYRGAPFYSSTCPIYVPESLIDDYQAATLWSNHADRYEPFPTTNKILYTTTDGQAAQYTLPDAYSSYAANISNTAPSSNTEDPGVGVLTFPFDLTEIPAGLFKDCRNLKTVHIPWDVQTIGNEAFRGCDALEAAYVRNTTNLTSLGARSFQNCYKLTTVGSSEGSVNLPMVSTVGEYAFYNALKVSEAHFPKLVTAGNFSFDNMGTSTTLRVIDVPKLENCGGLYTFGNITIDNLYLPSIKTLGRFSFGYSKIGTIHFGPNLLSMNSYCFTDSPEMTRSLYFEGTNPPTFQPYTFFIDYNVNTVLLPLEAIHVPSGCKVAYQNALHNASASYDAYFSIIVDDL